MEEYRKKKELTFDNDAYNEIDLSVFLNMFIRNKSTIFITTCIGSLLGIIYTLNQIPIYIGRFQIVVDTKKGKDSQVNPNQTLNNFITGQEPNTLKTEELILKSPSVLKPVYEYALTKYEMRNDQRKNWSFRKWSSTTLDIGFAKGTNILNIGFKDKDTKFILSTLGKISSEYQNYSKLSRDKSLIASINYLTGQKGILKEKALNSMKELNKFSIDNGLGDVDGFVTLGQSAINNDFQQFTKEDSISESKAGQRFNNQLTLLEKYEAEYTNYSSILKSNSKVLKNLKLKIENLKEALKRPNEILLKYKELSKVAKRNEIILNKIEDELDFTNLEIAKQKDPWEMIFKPTIDDIRISPKRKKTIIFSFLTSFAFGGILAFIKDKLSGKVYELEKLKSLIKCDLIGSVDLTTKELSKKMIYKFIESKTKENIKTALSKTYFVNTFGGDDYDDKNLTNTLFENEKNILITLKDTTKFEKAEYLIFFTNKNYIKSNDLNLINKLISLYSSKVLGWYFLEDK